jgi:RNA polymerase sigma factor (sigma-70 family)
VARACAQDGQEVLARARVEALLRAHRGTLLRLARRCSGTAEDAEDALQRALEIYVRRLPTLDPATELAWLKVVLRHEALALGAKRAASTPLEDGELAGQLPAEAAAVDERIESGERTARSLEALGALKPDERTALLLKAQGYSYAEIGRRQNWTYTKVNRAITEGRRRFMDVFRRIETGEECHRHAPALLRLVEGAGAAADLVSLRPHLRHCTACRATVRDLHRSRLHRLALHLPLVAGVAPARWLGDRLSDRPAPSGRTHLALLADRGAAAPAPRDADVAALIERGAAQPAPRGAGGLVHQLLARLHSPEFMTSAQLASSGGGRGAAVAAVLGLCLGAGGAGTYCLTSGGLPDPKQLLAGAPRVERKADAGKEKQRRARRRTAEPVTLTAAAVNEPRRPLVTPTPTPTPTRAATRRQPARTPPGRTSVKAARTPAPPAHEPQQQEFSFENRAAAPEPVAVAASASGGSTAAAAPRAPAPAPAPAPAAAGGGEFQP